MPDNAPGEKTEDPTPKRKRESREEGKVAKSQELSQAFTLLGGFLILVFLFNNLLFSLKNKVMNLLIIDKVPVLTPDNTFKILMENIIYIVRLVGPIMGFSAFMGLFINFVQVGPLFTVKSMQPKLSNINPVSGLKNIFSLKTIIELVKSLLKAIVIIFIAYTYIKIFWTDLITMTLQGLHPSLLLLGDLIFRIGLAVVIFLIFLGIGDYLYQRWEHYKNLKMTKYEIKQERKEMEGDPQIKQRRKEKQRQMSINRMMSEMEEADVVITNPTHVAVALKYKIEVMEAP
ncbi:MAG: EscU/YscU/HrcU family type III secretion system export apparatus switch protein, partial [Bacillota bacterium]